jgi:hypothetical protein
MPGIFLDKERSWTYFFVCKQFDSLLQGFYVGGKAASQFNGTRPGSEENTEAPSAFVGGDACLHAGDVDDSSFDGIIQRYGRGFCDLDNTPLYLCDSGGLRQVPRVRKLLSHAWHDFSPFA